MQSRGKCERQDGGGGGGGGGGHVRDKGRRGRLFSPSRSAVMQGRGYFSRLISTFFYSQSNSSHRRKSLLNLLRFCMYLSRFLRLL